MNIYDLLIIGTGPAGLSAAIYAARYKMNFICVGKMDGGTVNESHLVQNYPGINEITGPELGQKFKEHAEGLGAKIISENVKAIEKKDDIFTVFGANEKWQAKNIILAMGTEKRRLTIPGEKEFQGKGVSYCATCDGYFFKKKTVAVIGGGDSAITAALFLADLCEKVYLIYRGTELKAEPIWIQKVNEKENIEILFKKNIKEIKGDNIVKSISFKESEGEIELNGVFIEIGSTPVSSIITPLGVQTDDSGYLKIGEEQETNVKGLYAAGDISTGSFKFKQIVTATAEGAVATYAIYKELKQN